MDLPLPPTPNEAPANDSTAELPPLPVTPLGEEEPPVRSESIGSGTQSEGPQHTSGSSAEDSASVSKQSSAQIAPDRTSPGPLPSRPSNSNSQGETWVDFLRNPPPPSADTFTTGTISRERYEQRHDEMMADRKRRLTAAESPERRSGQGPSQSTSDGPSTQTDVATRLDRTVSGSSIAPIDLTSPRPRPAHLSRPLAPSPQRRQSDVVLPKWQPDSDVSACPVCNKTFTFFNRKHHCRKCGRVVCASCSPHRITIPRQFIVHPPALPSAIIDLTGEDPEEESPLGPPRQLWGGEEVRVCNPCVPDPNLSPPPQAALGDLGQPSNAPPTLPSLRQPPRRHRRSDGPFPQPPQYPGHRSTLSDAALLGSAQNPFHNRQLAFTNPTTVRDLWPPTLPPPQSHPGGVQYVPSYDGRTYQQPHHPGQIHPPRTSSTMSAPGAAPPPPYGYRHRSMLDITTPMQAPAQPPPPPQRRQIAEEDECPVCGNELPPKGPNGETLAREQHVTDCINSHSYSSTPPPRTNSAPGAPSTSIPTTSSSSSVPSGNNMPANSYASGSGTQRGRRMTASRMLVYDATEKDCVGEDGEASECVICFEEFEAGDEMGRLECLCRFHRACIRQWWDTKGIGSCPTHQLHD